MVDSLSDLVDAQIIHALHIDGRAPFSLIAQVLGVADQTVARRYHRLRSAGLLRVRGVVEASRTGRTQLIVRIRCTPGTVVTLADALARRGDVSWVSLTSGGAEIVCVLTVPSDDDQRVLLLDRLPLRRDVLAIDAHFVLHEFFGGARGLVAKNGPLTPDQIAALRPAADHQPIHVSTLGPEDDRLVRALEHDGRASIVALAAATGWSPSTPRRRIATLIDSGALYFHVDVDQTLVDLRMRAIMWLQVPVDRLELAGRALAAHPEVGYAAATTGPTNLYAAVSCRTSEALYSYLTERVAHLGTIDRLETTPIMRSVKTSGSSANPTP